MTASLFQYSIGVSIPLLVMWVAYRTALANQKQLTRNRLMLVATYAVSLVLLPMLNWFAPATTVVYATAGDVATIQHAFDWSRWMAWGWLAGASCALVFTLVEIVRILLMVRGCEKIERNGRIIHLTDRENQSPFSLGRCIVMNRRDFEESCDEILAHEDGHIHYLHSWDMILAQMVAILCWYNPAAWLMRSELKAVHEFQADAHAMGLGLDAKAYQVLLVNKAAGTRFPVIGNNFRHGNLKKRIAMMNRPDAPRHVSRIACLAPAVGAVVAISVMVTPEVRSAIAPRHTVRTESTAPMQSTGENYEIFVDDIAISEKELESLNPGDIKAITVHKDNTGNRIHVETKR